MIKSRNFINVVHPQAAHFSTTTRQETLITPPQQLQYTETTRNYIHQTTLYLPDTCARYAQAFHICHNVVKPSPFCSADHHFHAFHALPVPAPLSASRSCASSTVSDPPRRTRVFLALRRLLSASFAFCKVRTSAGNRVTECANACVPFASWSTAVRIGVGELSW